MSARNPSSFPSPSNGSDAPTPGIALPSSPDGPLRLHRSGLALLVALALVLVGCGYSLVGKTTNIPDDVRAVHVETLVNGTPRQQVEQILTQAILEELVTRRAFALVDSAAEADAQLRGKVMGVTLRPISFDAQGLANNFEIQITADMRFERTTRGAETEPEVIWKNSRYVFRQDYPIDAADTVNYLERETEAIEETASSFAQTLVTDLLAGF